MSKITSFLLFKIKFSSVPGPETIKKSGAWIGAQLTILCLINRKLRSGDYKEIGAVLSLSFVLEQL